MDLSQININELKPIQEIDNSQSLFVNYSGQVYYGYSQMWFEESIRKKGGCGPVSFLNSLQIMEHKHPAIKSFLDETLWPLDPVQRMEYIYEDFKPVELTRNKVLKGPWTLGVFSIGRYKKLVHEFSLKHGFGLTVSEGSMDDEETLVQWVSAKLAKGYPVLCLNTFGKVKVLTVTNQRKVHDFRYHWVLITGIYKLEDHYMIRVTTWGRVGYVSLNELRVKRGKLDFLSPAGFISIDFDIDSRYQL